MLTEKKLRQIIRHVIVEHSGLPAGGEFEVPDNSNAVEELARNLVNRSVYETDIWQPIIVAAVRAVKSGDREAASDPVYTDEILADIYDSYGSEMAQKLGNADQTTREDLRLHLIDSIKCEFEEFVDAKLYKSIRDEEYRFD